MLPTLAPGQEFVACDSVAPGVGDIVTLEHPHRPEFWLVKRVDSIDDRDAWLVSDNEVEGTVDSRSFGAVAVEDLMPVVTHLDEPMFGEALDLLTEEDDSLARAAETYGRPDFWHREPGFRTLVLLILEQQVSLESGAAMYQRLDALAPGVTPGAILEAGEDRMRAIGVTRQKAGYLRSLAEAVDTGSLDLASLGNQPESDARTELVALKGIGLWTADAYLLSALRLPDMWPVGDRALQVGTREVLDLEKDPDEEQLDLLGEAWRPIRAAAARLIWHAYLTKRGRVEPPSPF